MTDLPTNPATPPFAWPYAAMLALSLALGIAIAAGADAWRDRGNTTAAGVLADCAAPMLIAAAMAVFGHLTRTRLFEHHPPAAAAGQAAGNASGPLK